MKGKLDEESRSALIRYRLQRAEQTLDEAKVMSDATYYNAFFLDKQANSKVFS